MSSLDTLTDRIRSEFRELPGLKITFQQACRLWHSNEAVLASPQSFTRHLASTRE
jgi:hypothetical protein